MLAAFTAGLLLISVSELGDKSFFISAILATRHQKRWVFLGSFVALLLMTVLSVLLGQVFALLPRAYTVFAAMALFVVFGLRLLNQAWKMPKANTCEETAEAEAVVAKAEAQRLKTKNNSAWPTLLEAFSLTFLAEWGDRTQIATMTLAVTQNPWGVAVGAIVGHGICTLIAVLGGGFLAGRISERNLTALGGILFLIFAVVILLEGT